MYFIYMTFVGNYICISIIYFMAFYNGGNWHLKIRTLPLFP